jgi:hypothetical protein
VQSAHEFLLVVRERRFDENDIHRFSVCLN